MANFPTGFENEPHILQPTDLRPAHSENLSRLQAAGYDVVAGLDRSSVPHLTEIAQQEGTREFCPNDIKRRWGDEVMAEKQLAKDGGRGVLRLVARETGATFGFGWTGSISEEEQEYLPMCENTFALRLHEAARGRRLGSPFSRVIVAGSMALWGARNIGLETWASNTAAVRTYLSAGAQLVTTKDDVRPTLDRQKFSHQNHRNDVRLYMHYPWSAK
jgi:hypothetical protein